MNASTFRKMVFVVLIVAVLGAMLSACGSQDGAKDDTPKVYKLDEGNYAACSQGYTRKDVTTWGKGTAVDALKGICQEAAYRAAEGYTIMVGDKVIFTPPTEVNVK